MEAGYNPATALTTPFTGDLSNWLITAMATTFTITVANPTPAAAAAPAVPTGVTSMIATYLAPAGLAAAALLVLAKRSRRNEE
ncbi:MAG: hypothetical protein LBR25_09235, partial [Erysipelotrichaceae bacterium]|jgi:hypothetical protein|nr:hypothetical protein [Erysipelotrichaceae bacterium]